jgi:hypothetical protein
VFFNGTFLGQDITLYFRYGERIGVPHRKGNRVKTYLVTLVDRVTDEVQKIWVNSPCPCDMQEFVDNPPPRLKADLLLDHPVVVKVEESKIAFDALVV